MALAWVNAYLVVESFHSPVDVVEQTLASVRLNDTRGAVHPEHRRRQGAKFSGVQAVLQHSV